MWTTTLVYENIKYIRLFSGVPQTRMVMSKTAFPMATSSESSEIKPVLLYGDMPLSCRPVNNCKMNDLE